MLEEAALKRIFKAARGITSSIIQSSIRKKFKEKSFGRYSLLIFKRRASVSFLEASEHKETLYGYLLLIETGDLLFVLGKRTLDFKDEVLSSFDFLGGAELVGASLSESS